MADRIKILLVDDQPHFADLAKAFLEREDDRFEIDTVTSPSDGLEYLESTTYDCIVSDFDMPGTNGLEFFEAVNDREFDLPFILFSGMTPDEIGDAQEFDGVTAYLQKGGSGAFEDLASRIRLSVSEHRADRSLIDIETRYDALFGDSPLPMAWVCANGQGPILVDHNDRFQAEFANGTDAIVGTELERAIDAATLDPATIEHALAAGEATTIEGERLTDDVIRRYRWQIIPVVGRPNDDEAHGLIAAYDESELAENEHELERYRTIVEASGDPMYVLDITGSFTYVNDALVELVGRDRDELVGASGHLVMSEADYREGTEMIKELLRCDRDTGTFEMDLLTATGQQIPCENHLTLIYDVETGDGDKVKGTAGVLRDITERKQHIAELRRYNERLEELAAFISHDLRNPITVANGRLDLIEADEDCHHLQAVHRALGRMEELVDDLLRMARSGQTVIDPKPVSLHEAASLSWSQVSETEATLEIATDRSVIGDESRIKQLFENLFANAIVHGGSNINVTLGNLEDGFFVEDTGPGIDPEARETVFDFGYTTGEDGTGFGLPIVQAVAEAHDWSVALTEGRTGGARFEFTDVTIVERRRDATADPQ